MRKNKDFFRDADFADYTEEYGRKEKGEHKGIRSVGLSAYRGTGGQGVRKSGEQVLKTFKKKVYKFI